VVRSDSVSVSVCWAAALLFYLFAGAAHAAKIKLKEPGIWNYEDKLVRIEVRLQGPENMGAFYEARGFTRAAIELVAAKCFVTVSILNKAYPVLWLEPARWSIVTKDKTIKRYPIDFWQQQFDSVALPDAKRAAFRWTQIPEQRDLRPDEPVGGNISLPPLTEKFTLALEFDIGADRSERLQMQFPDLYCKGRLQ
jgi:hypothetical protein